jgi:protein ImuB
MFAVLFIADFALHAVLRTESAPADRTAALFAGTGKKSVVLAATPAARAAGVEPGMTAPQAVARCPALVIRTPVAAAEAEARAALLAVGLTLGPLIEDTAPGVCTIDLKGASRRPEPIAAAAIRHLATLGLPATAGIARTPLLALYAAQENNVTTAQASEPEFLFAEDAVSFASFGPRTGGPLSPSASSRTPSHPGVHTVADERAFLAPLALSVTDPSPELAAVLHAWGLRTCGELTALPRDEIVRRFGAAGLALWQRATGGEPRPLRPVTLAAHFTAAMEFEEAIETLEPLLFLLRRFLDRLTLELRTAQFVAAEIELTLRLEDDTRHPRHFRLPEPTADPEILFRTLHTHLESLQTAAAITALELRLVPTRPLVRQHGLFDTGLRDPHGFAETLARVAALVPADHVGSPRGEDTHRPDAFTLHPPPAIVPPPAEPPVHPPHGLPLRRFRPPLPATLAFSPDNQKPAYLHTAQFEGAITIIRGPWRSSGDWWQADRAWSRLEWDIALADGGVYRLLLVGEAYFVEGEYD